MRGQDVSATYHHVETSAQSLRPRGQSRDALETQTMQTGSDTGETKSECGVIFSFFSATYIKKLSIINRHRPTEYIDFRFIPYLR